MVLPFFVFEDVYKKNRFVSFTSIDKLLKMKYLPILLIAITFACSPTKSTETESFTEELPEEEVVGEPSFSQITTTVDTVASNYVIRQLINYQSFDASGGISFINYSFESPSGESATPDNQWALSVYEDRKSTYPNMRDTVLIISPNQYSKDTYRFDKEGNLIYFENFFYTIIAEVNAKGNPTLIKVGIADERSGEYTWFLIERDYTNNLSKLTTYLTINGDNIFEKPKRTIVDYFVMMRLAGIYNPDGIGSFDVKNGYLEHSDEGTGAGEFISQLVLFKKNDGTDCLAIAYRSIEAVDHVWVSSHQPPKFYQFNGASFDEVKDIFPELSGDLFLPEGISSDEVSVQTFYVLPQKGLAITYNLNYDPIIDYCETRLVDLKDNMSQEDFAYKKKMCEVFNTISLTSIKIPFDKETGTFSVAQ